MRSDLKSHIYGFANLITWIILSVIAVVLIFHFVSSWILCTILIPVAVIGLAFLGERVLCRVVNSIVDFILHDKD